MTSQTETLDKNSTKTREFEIEVFHYTIKLTIYGCDHIIGDDNNEFDVKICEEVHNYISEHDVEWVWDIDIKLSKDITNGTYNDYVNLPVEDDKDGNRNGNLHLYGFKEVGN